MNPARARLDEMSGAGLVITTTTELEAFITRAEDAGTRRKSPAGHFQIHYLLRTPPKGRCNGMDGVDDIRLVDTYAAALDNTYRRLRSMKWQVPDRGPAADPITVLVIDTPYPYKGKAPLRPGGVFIALRSELEETTHDDVERRAWVDATHEVVHLYSHQHRMRIDGHMDPWAWFDEATAVYFERRLNQGSRATLSNGYALSWVNQPEIRLEWEEGGHEGAWLIQYLVKRHGPRLLHEIWHEARPYETPCQVVDRLLKGHNSSLENLIHDYAVRSHHTRAFDQIANERYGDRKFAYVWPLDRAGDLPAGGSDHVEPLGCRYYRIGPVRAPRRIAVAVAIDEPGAAASLMVTAHAERPGGNSRPRPKRLEPDRATGANNRLVAHLEAGIPGTEFVLVVTHLAPTGPYGDRYDATVKYQVEVNDD